MAALRENEGRCPSCGQEHDTNGGNLAFPDLQDAIEVNKGVLEEMPGTGAHTVWDEGMVDSALHRPQQRAVYDEDADVFDMAADLAHGVVQNHGFENGNHRTAHILTHAFLENNGFGHVVGEDDDELARHILGYTSHGQAKNEGEAHTPAETAQVFRDRHAKHLAGEDLGIKPYERKEVEANIPHPKHEVDSPILFEHLDGDYHNFDDEVFGNLLSKGHSIDSAMRLMHTIEHSRYPYPASRHEGMDCNAHHEVCQECGRWTCAKDAACPNCGYAWENPYREGHVDEDGSVTHHGDDFSAWNEDVEGEAAKADESCGYCKGTGVDDDGLECQFCGGFPHFAAKKVCPRCGGVTKNEGLCKACESQEELPFDKGAGARYVHGPGSFERYRRRSHSTGTIVSIFDTSHPRSDLDPEGGRWATVCWGRSGQPSHGGVVNHSSYATARSFAAHPEEWCETCMGYGDDTSPYANAIKQGHSGLDFGMHVHESDDPKNDYVYDQCRNCGHPIRFTGMDPSVPWVHEYSGNGYCDVTGPENAVENTWANEFGIRDEAAPTHGDDWPELPDRTGNTVQHLIVDHGADPQSIDHTNSSPEDVAWVHSQLHEGHVGDDQAEHHLKDLGEMDLGDIENTPENLTALEQKVRREPRDPTNYSFAGYGADLDDMAAEVGEDDPGMYMHREQMNAAPMNALIDHFHQHGWSRDSQGPYWDSWQDYKREGEGTSGTVTEHHQPDVDWIRDWDRDMRRQHEDDHSYHERNLSDEPFRHFSHVGDDDSQHVHDPDEVRVVDMGEVTKDKKPCWECGGWGVLTRGDDMWTCPHCDGTGAEHKKQAHVGDDAAMHHGPGPYVAPPSSADMGKFPGSETGTEHMHRWHVGLDWDQHDRIHEQPNLEVPHRHSYPGELPGDREYMHQVAQDMPDLLRWEMQIQKGAHVGDDAAMHHVNEKPLREQHPYGDECVECHGVGMDINAKSCATCQGIGVAYDDAYWDTDEQLHDFPNYPAFQQMKVDGRMLDIHLKEHGVEGKPDNPWMQHAWTHGRFQVDKDTAGIVFSELDKGKKSAALEAALMHSGQACGTCGGGVVKRPNGRLKCQSCGHDYGKAPVSMPVTGPTNVPWWEEKKGHVGDDEGQHHLDEWESNFLPADSYTVCAACGSAFPMGEFKGHDCGYRTPKEGHYGDDMGRHHFPPDKEPYDQDEEEMEDCPGCDGLGTLMERNKRTYCKDCGGTGWKKKSHIGDDEGRHHADDFSRWDAEVEPDELKPPKVCRECEGSGTTPDGGTCEGCGGYGTPFGGALAAVVAVNRTRAWYLKQRDKALGEFGPDQSKAVGEFEDGWSVRKLHTVGDAQYEGTLMKNCIKDVGLKSCDTCRGFGTCPECKGDSMVLCPKCDGLGEVTCTARHPKDFEETGECNRCNGIGAIDCASCDGHGVTNCKKCSGEGSCPKCDGEAFVPQDSSISLDSKKAEHEYKDSYTGKSVLYSLRDPDNIPQVSFTMNPNYARGRVTQGNLEATGLGIDSTWGRANTPPKFEHMQRLVSFFTDHTKRKPGEHTIGIQDLSWMQHEYLHQPSKMVDLKCRSCIEEQKDKKWNERLKTAGFEWVGEFEAQSWDSADTYARNPDHHVAPGNTGQRGPYDPWDDVGDHGELVTPSPQGKDVKKWVKHRTFPGDKPFAEHPQTQDRIDNMPQIVGAKATEVAEPEPIPVSRVVNKDRASSAEEAAAYILDGLRDVGWTDLNVKQTGQNQLGHWVVNLTGFPAKREKVEDEAKTAALPGTWVTLKRAEFTPGGPSNDWEMDSKPLDVQQPRMHEDPWVDVGDTGNPEHNPKLKKNRKVKKVIPGEQNATPSTMNYPGSGLMSEARTGAKTNQEYREMAKDMVSKISQQGGRYKDKSKVVHEFGDGWSIRKLTTYGDLRYEGNMMGNCIAGVAEQSCGKCFREGSGRCGAMGHQEVDRERTWDAQWVPNPKCRSCQGSGECRGCGGAGRRLKSSYPHGIDRVKVNNAPYCLHGDHMGATGCVGSHIYSLRNSDNVPVASFFFDRGSYDEKKGGPKLTPPPPLEEARIEDCNRCRGTGFADREVPSLDLCDRCEGTGKNVVAPYQESGDELGIKSVYGRDNQPPNLSHARRVLEYAKSLSEKAGGQRVHIGWGGGYRYGPPYGPSDFDRILNNKVMPKGNVMFVHHAPAGQKPRDYLLGLTKKEGDFRDFFDTQGRLRVQDVQDLELRGHKIFKIEDFTRGKSTSLHRAAPEDLGNRIRYDFINHEHSVNLGGMNKAMLDKTRIDLRKNPPKELETDLSAPQQEWHEDTARTAAIEAGGVCDACHAVVDTTECGDCLSLLCPTCMDIHQQWAHPQRKTAGWDWVGEFSANDWTDWELETLKPREPFLMAPHRPEDEAKPFHDPTLGTRVFPNWTDDRLERHVLEDHAGSLREHYDIHHGRDDDADWTGNVAHYHDDAFLNRLHGGQQCEWPCSHSKTALNEMVGAKVVHYMYLKPKGFPEYPGEVVPSEWTVNCSAHMFGRPNRGRSYTQDPEEVTCRSCLTSRPVQHALNSLMDKEALFNPGQGSSWDPVRDVQPSSESAPAPSAQGRGRDPWVDQGDNGTAPPRPGYIWDSKLKKWLRDTQLTYPSVGPTFPGVTDINKVGMRKASMALTKAGLGRMINKFGPYVYHHTSDKNVDSILEKGILPWDHKDNAAGNWTGSEYQPRPNHTYLHTGSCGELPAHGLTDWLSGEHSGGPCPIRVDLRKLNLDRFATDEDVAHWHLGLGSEGERKGDFPELDKDCPKCQGSGLVGVGEEDCPKCHGEGIIEHWNNLGEWAQNQPNIDRPKHVEESMRLGLLAFNGRVPKKAIDLNPQWVDPSHRKKVAGNARKANEPPQEPGQWQADNGIDDPTKDSIAGWKTKKVLPKSQVAFPSSNDNLNVSIDNQNKVGALTQNEPREEEMTDMAQHLVNTHAFDPATVGDPGLYNEDELGELHQYDHEHGFVNHNPEVLRVASQGLPIKEEGHA